MKPEEEDNPFRMPTVSGPGANASDVGAVPEVRGYEILGVLDEGGMGVVYVARQMRPIRRRVAMKVIKPGMDSKRVISRFETERQALALLDHPNIAQVYDAGATRDGRPYFAMEYVQGLSITEYCDREKLGIEERLELFKHVCEGVQHAHQKGIIHRDIKPSNILVYSEGDSALAKIIDFGVAKAIGPSLTGQTLYTETGQFIGTPEYMSPEQADMASQDIDTRSDIYSLGAVLYELLTGVLPFDSEVLRDGGIEQFRQVIRNETPKTPSTRVTSLGGRAVKVALNRGTEVRTLVRRLHKELEWIPLKAMRKERTRRYRSAAELADDIQHYLDGAPLAAGPESGVYRLSKFVARNRRLVASVAAVLAVLLAGVVVSTYFALSAESARIEAQAVSDFLRNDLLASVNQFMAEDPNVPFRSILDAGSARLSGKFPDQPLVEAWLRETLGYTYRRLGLYESAERHLTRALDIYRSRLGGDDPATLACTIGLGWVHFCQRHHEQAQKLLTEARQAQQRMRGANQPQSLQPTILLACVYSAQGLWDQAAPLFEQTLAALGDEHPDRLFCISRLAEVYRGQGRYDKAEELYRDLLQTYRRTLGDEDPNTLHVMVELADLHHKQDRYDEAEPLYAEAIETRRRLLGDDDPNTLGTVNMLVVLRMKQKRYEEAASLCKEALTLCRRVLPQENALAITLANNLAVAYKELKRYDEAKELLLEAVENAIKLEQWGPLHPNTQRSIQHLVDVYETTGQLDEAENWREKLRNTQGSAD